MRILLAVDGSEASLRAVDHLCFMVGESEESKVTLLHVKPRFGDYCGVHFDDQTEAAGRVIARGEKRCIDDFYAHALDKFKEVGLKETQLEVQVIQPTMDVGKAIVNQAKKGRYGAIVVGRTGTSKAFFMGSVSRQVLNKVSGRAVWLVP